jgi:hypothetical protein
MSSRAELLRRISELMGRVPGVSVNSRRLAPGVGYIEFTVASEDSTRALERIALGANVGIEPWPRTTEPHVVRTLSALIRNRDEIVHGELQLLGIHLVWYLHRVGVLATAEANPLLREWRAAELGG